MSRGSSLRIALSSDDCLGTLDVSGHVSLCHCDETEAELVGALRRADLSSPHGSNHSQKFVRLHIDGDILE